MPETFYRAVHKNQTVALRVSDQLIAALEAADANIYPHYLPQYEAGVLGNKVLLAHLHELRGAGITSVEGTLTEYPEPEERVGADGRRVMVISSDWEGYMTWQGPWDDDRRGTTLDPSDLVLEEVALAHAPFICD